MAPLHEGPLTDFVPSPTLRWVLLAEPRRIAEQPGLLRVLSPLIGDAAWEQFSERNGFDLRKTPRALVAGFEMGNLYLIEERQNGLAIELQFRERLLRGEVVEHPHPRLTRVRGVVGETPQALLRAHDQLVALSTGDITLVRVVEGYLRGRFHKTPTALAGAALRSHAEFANEAPLRLWIPGPVDGAGGLIQGLFPSGHLEGVSAVMAAVELFEHKACPCQEGTTSGPAARLRVALAGPWHPEEVTATPLAETWAALATSATGQLLELHRPLRQPEVSVTPVGDGASRLELTVELALGPILRALQGALAADLAELFTEQTAPSASP